MKLSNFRKSLALAEVCALPRAFWWYYVDHVFLPTIIYYLWSVNRYHCFIAFLHSDSWTIN